MENMKKFTLLAISLATNVIAYSQVGINTGNTIDASAVLEVESTSKGLLLPRISSHTLVNNPTNGLIIYDIGDQCINVYANGWIDLCENMNSGGSSSAGVSLQCGDGYTTETVVSAETTAQTGASLLVTESGELMVAGRVIGLFQGMTSQYNYDFNIINGPWPDGSVLYADITGTTAGNTSNTIPYAVVGTTDGVYYSYSNVANWSKATTYTGGTITKVQVSRVGGTSILDANGDIYFSPTLDSDSFTKITALDNITITNVVAGGGNEATSGTSYMNYAWAEGDTTLYYWENDPNNVQTYTFPSNIVDVGSAGKPRNITSTIVALEDGSLYIMGAFSYFGLGTSNTDYLTPVTLPLTPIDRPLDADEKVVKVGVGRLDIAHFVTNKGNVYSHTDDIGWYHEYEIKVADPTTVDFSVAGSTKGLLARIDGNLAVWAADTKGTGPNTGDGAVIAEGSGISSAAGAIISTPLYVPICIKN